MNSYDIIAKAVKEYIEEKNEQNYIIDYCYIVHFYQKYAQDDEWEECTEVIEIQDLDDITFMMDFCEGQTDVKDISIMALWEIGDIMDKAFKLLTGGKK